MSAPEGGFPQIMSLARGFQGAQMLMVAVELGVFDYLEEPRTPAEAAVYLKTEARATGIFFHGLAALGLLEKVADKFRNGDAASRYLVRGKEEYRGAIIRHMGHTLRGWLDLEATLAQGRPPEVDPEKWLDAHERRSEDEVRDFIWGMHAFARDLAPQVAAKLNLAGVRRFLDLGAGPATYAIVFVQNHPEMEAYVFDLPGPIKIAQDNIARHGLSGRIHTLGGNFLKDDIGRGYDFIWISQILHSHTVEQCHFLLQKAVQALNPGGQLAVQEFFLQDDGISPPAAAIFSVHMLAVTPGGRSYFTREVAAWLEQAGLTPPEYLQTGPETGVLVGRKK